MPKRLALVTSSPEETAAVGRALGELAQPGDIVLLIGELGTGKTCLTQGIGQGIGVATRVRSPTFVLINVHKGRLKLYHIDLFRLNSPKEAENLDLDEYLFGSGICVIEWADRAMSLFPSERLEMRLSYGPKEAERVLELIAVGERYKDLLVKLAKQFNTLVQKKNAAGD